ncbi:MAG: redoxin domain-containing protein [Planctomycetes bacterium]|nr:redoxin domain-containing protein [Planctomycetota bacterium]
MIKAKIMFVLVLGLACSLRGAVPETGGLVVSVSDEKNRPVSIAHVQMWIKTNAGGQAFTFAAEPTETPGMVRISKLPARDYEGLKINKANYAPGWVKHIKIVGGKTAEIKCVLVKGGSISGSVINEKGVPVPEISVVANSVFCRRDVVTDKYGAFEATHLYACKYSVSAEPDKDSDYKITFYEHGAYCGEDEVLIVLKKTDSASKPRREETPSQPDHTQQDDSESDLTRASVNSQKASLRSLLGKPAPPLIIEQWYNSSFWKLDVNNKVVVLHFWGVWCSACKPQIPALCQLARKYGHDGLEVIGVHTYHFKHGIPEFLSSHALPYTIAVDNNEQTREAYHVTTYPTTAVIDRKGMLRAINPKNLEETVKNLLSEGRQ